MSCLHLIVYFIFHFCVDLSCIYYLMSTAAVAVPDHAAWLFCMVLYNFMAFAFPLILGVLADAVKKNALFAAAGCFLVCLGYCLRSRLLLSVVLLGLGNGLYHIGGGRQVLQDAGARYADSGIFIASGAVGVFLGHTLGSRHLVLYPVFIAVLLLGGLVILAMKLYDDRRAPSPEQAEEKLPRKRPHPAGLLVPAAGMLLLAIFLRSCYGYLTVYTWNNCFLTGLLFVLCVAAGKFTGGLLADRFGIVPAAAGSLLAAGILALFSFSVPVCGMLSILCFNMTMPLGLTLLYRLFPDAPGLSFGMLMLALFLGTLPDTLGDISVLSCPAGLFLLCLVSLGLLLGAVFLMKKKGCAP